MEASTEGKGTGCVPGRFSDNTKDKKIVEENREGQRKCQENR